MCLKQMARLRLNAAQARMISGFVDTYLRLEAQEEEVFQRELDRIESREKEGVMEVVTSWMEAGIERGIERGIEQGIERGIERGERSLILRQLNRRFGSLPQVTQAQVEALSLERLELLGEALLDFTSLVELENWLAQ